MGYHTEFSGSVSVEPPLNDHEIAYLKDFNDQDHRAQDMPGYWCQWEPTKDGTAIEWDGGEKFYDSVEWMEFIIDHFLCAESLHKNDPGLKGFTFNHTVNGTINAYGEDAGDIWRLIVKDNVVSQQESTLLWPVDEEEDVW